MYDAKSRKTFNSSFGSSARKGYTIRTPALPPDQREEPGAKPSEEVEPPPPTLPERQYYGRCTALQAERWAEYHLPEGVPSVLPFGQAAEPESS